MSQELTTINNEVKELQLFLEDYPEEAIELACNYFEDFLILFQEYQKLKQYFEKIPKSKNSLISRPMFADKSLTLEQEFRVSCLKMRLIKSPSKAKIFAVTYFENFLHLVILYQKLEAQLLQLLDSNLI